MKLFFKKLIKRFNYECESISIKTKIPCDKIKHFFVNFVPSFILGFFVEFDYIFIFMNAINVGKEAKDKFDGGKFSVPDLMADNLGLFAGYILATFIKRGILWVI
jgi:hypothetical protein